MLIKSLICTNSSSPHDLAALWACPSCIYMPVSPLTTSHGGNWNGYSSNFRLAFGNKSSQELPCVCWLASCIFLLQHEYGLLSSGLQYVLEVRKDFNNTLDGCYYICAVCSKKMTAHTLVAHIKSMPHRLKFSVSIAVIFLLAMFCISYKICKSLT